MPYSMRMRMRMSMCVSVSPFALVRLSHVLFRLLLSLKALNINYVRNLILNCRLLPAFYFQFPTGR